MKVLAIDPGNVQSAYVLMDENYKPLVFGKLDNDIIAEKIGGILGSEHKPYVVIEMVASYGMSVGQTVFDTCVWIGMFKQICLDYNANVNLMFRKTVKMNLCGQTRAKDSNITQALIDRFAPATPNRGKGHKATPGWFYGFRADMWQAYALGVTWLDEYKLNKRLICDII